MSRIHPAILCGGAGTRLWPLSREKKPKQFLPLTAEKSMLAETVARARHIEGAVTPMIVTSASFADDAAKEAALAGTDGAAVIVEPSPKNTAAAAALAAFQAAEDSPDAIVLLFPSDHHVANAAAFLEASAAAAEAAAAGAIVTLGIQPQGPHTGYGYIKRGAPQGRAFVVERFTEKPDAETAAAFLASGDYAWNAGIYAFRADVFLSELKRHRPAIHDAVETAWKARKVEAMRIAPDAAAWATCPSESIDNAVAEQTDKAVVVPADMGWSDVGSWGSLWEIAPRDEAGNAIYGDVAIVDSNGCYVRAGERHVALLGVSDLVVVETPDAVLIIRRDRAEDVKKLVQLGRAALK